MPKNENGFYSKKGTHRLTVWEKDRNTAGFVVVGIDGSSGRQVDKALKIDPMIRLNI